MSRKRRFTAEEAAQIITEDLADAEYLDEVIGRIDEFLQNNDNNNMIIFWKYRI